MMKILTRILFVLIVLLSSRFAEGYANEQRADSAGFFSLAADMPLMPGLQEKEDETFVFDKPQGRIATLTAMGPHIRPEDTKTFYQNILPQFGWQRIQNQTFRRGHEILKTNYKKEDEGTVVIFEIRPYGNIQTNVLTK